MPSLQEQAQFPIRRELAKLGGELTGARYHNNTEEEIRLRREISALKIAYYAAKQLETSAPLNEREITRITTILRGGQL